MSLKWYLKPHKIFTSKNYRAAS